MKRVCCFLAVVCAAVLLLSPRALAHPGRTDGDGGHHDYNNVSGLGNYHFHHGHPAHLHTGGVCPYDFDNKTGQNSGSSSGESVTRAAATSPTPSHSASASTPRLLWWILLGGGMAMLLVLLLKAHLKQRRELRAFEAERARLSALYGDKTAQELAHMAGMPDDVELGPDGLPKERGAVGWGERFTYYVAPSGKAFHSVRGCNRSAVIPVNAASLGGLHSCSRCRADYPSLAWYHEYQRIRAVMRKYGILPMNAPFICGTALRRTEDEKLAREAAASGMTVAQYQEFMRLRREEDDIQDNR